MRFRDFFKKDYVTALVMVKNMCKALKRMGIKERYSGGKSAILQSVSGGAVVNTKVAKMLKVLISIFFFFNYKT